MCTLFKFGAALIANERYFSLVGKVRVPGKTLTGTVVKGREVVKGGGKGLEECDNGTYLDRHLPKPQGSLCNIRVSLHESMTKEGNLRQFLLTFL